MKRQSNVTNVRLKQEIDASEFPDGLIYMEDPNTENLKEAATLFLDECEKSSGSETKMAKMCVPPSKAPLLIGKAGKTVQKLSFQTNAKIDLQDHVLGLDDRVIEISSRNLNNIVRAIIKIYDMVTGREHTIRGEGMDQQASLFSSGSLSLVVDEYQARQLEDETRELEDVLGSVDWKILTTNCRPDQRVIQINGAPASTRRALGALLKYIDETSRNEADLVLLLEARDSSKVIGYRGFVVKDIFQRLKGASLKRCEDRAYDPMTAISITGSLKQKVDLANCIYDFLEGKEFHDPYSSSRRRDSPRMSPKSDPSLRRSQSDSYNHRQSYPDKFNERGDRGRERQRDYRDQPSALHRSPPRYEDYSRNRDQQWSPKRNSFERPHSGSFDYSYKKSPASWEFGRESPREYRPRYSPDQHGKSSRFSPPREQYNVRSNSPPNEKPTKSESALNIIVPDDLVSRLIGKNGENVRNIMTRTYTHIKFFKSGENPAVKTSDGNKGRL